MWTEGEDPFDLPFTFLGLPTPPEGAEAAAVRIWPIPYDGTTSYRGGARFGPQAIIDASRYVETYDEERGWDLADLGIGTLPPVARLLGDGERMMSRIERLAAGLVAPGRMLVSLGGEHSITAPLVRAHARHYPDLVVVQLDAHADLREAYEGTKTSHAAVMRQVVEVAPTIGIGIRAISAEEARWLRAQDRAEVVFAHELRRDPERARRRLGSMRGHVYLTIDLDVFDPGLVPGVGTPEPGGLGWDQVLDLLAALTANTTVVGADVVELAPIPGSVVSEFVAARVVEKIIAYTFGRSSTE